MSAVHVLRGRTATVAWTSRAERAIEIRNRKQTAVPPARAGGRGPRGELARQLVPTHPRPRPVHAKSSGCCSTASRTRSCATWRPATAAGCGLSARKHGRSFSPSSASNPPRRRSGETCGGSAWYPTTANIPASGSSGTGSPSRRSAGPPDRRPRWTSGSQSPDSRRVLGAGHSADSASSGGPARQPSPLDAGHRRATPRPHVRQVAAGRGRRRGHRELEVVPFTNADGTVETGASSSKEPTASSSWRCPRRNRLRHGQVEDHAANVAAVAKWELSVVPPDDLRTDETEALGTRHGRGSSSRQSTSRWLWKRTPSPTAHASS